MMIPKPRAQQSREVRSSFYLVTLGDY